MDHEYQYFWKYIHVHGLHVYYLTFGTAHIYRTVQV